MKKTLNFKGIFSDGCVINTVLLILLYIAGVSIDPDFIPTLPRVFGILIYSLVLAGANALFFSSKMKTFPRLLLHFIATAAAFCICFVLVGGYKATPGSVAVIVLLYLLVYAVAAAFVALIRYIVKADDNTKKDGKKSDGRKTDGKKKTESKSDEYTSIFNGKK